MKITIATCCNHREKATELFLIGFNRLKKHCATIGIELSCAAVITTGDKKSAELCDKYGARYIHHANSPLGAKWNAAINFALSLAPHYVLRSGDDDVLLNGFFAEWNKNRFEIGMWQGDNRLRTGFRTAYILERNKAGLFRHKHVRAIGTGYLLHAEILKEKSSFFPVKWLRPAKGSAFDQSPWLSCALAELLQHREYVEIIGDRQARLFPDNINDGCDFNMDIILADRGIEVEVIETDTPQIVCIKTPGKNIWDFNAMNMHRQLNTNVDFETVLNVLPEEEKEFYIKHFMK